MRLLKVPCLGFGGIYGQIWKTIFIIIDFVFNILFSSVYH